MEAILSQLGSNSMCCARTAALQGGCVKQKVNASRDFLQQSMHPVQPSFESYAKTTFGSCLAKTSRPRAKNVPTWSQHTPVLAWISEFWPPTKEGKAVC